MNQIDVGALVEALMYIVPLIALIFSAQTFQNASKERHEKSATDAANLKADLTHLTAQVQELKESYGDTHKGYLTNVNRITKLEEQVKTLWNKMEALEREVHNGN